MILLTPGIYFLYFIDSGRGSDFHHLIFEKNAMDFGWLDVILTQIYFLFKFILHISARTLSLKSYFIHKVMHCSIYKEF